MGSSKTEQARVPLELVHVDLMTGLQGHPNYHHALVFSCLTWIHLLKKDHTGKHGVRAIPGIMIGYDNEHKGWRFYTPGHSPSIQWSNLAMFHESKSWHDQPRTQSPLQFGLENLEAKDMKQEPDNNEPELEVEVINIWDPLLDECTTPPIDSTDDDRLEITVKEILGEAQMAILNLTPTLKEALASDDARQWQEAICKELDGLEAMGTWEIVDTPPNANLVDSKIVLRLKLDADGIPV
ncbi:hypothetical protein NDA17_002715 [Ustilago hordei]|nr:hypothetical protein NDA17_002715 [Ustilago hordei]